jgi:hypothetical protein
MRHAAKIRANKPFKSMEMTAFETIDRAFFLSHLLGIVSISLPVLTCNEDPDEASVLPQRFYCLRIL